MIYDDGGLHRTVSELSDVGSFWYLATVYSKHPRGINAAFEEAAKVSARLVEQGLAVFSPIAHSHPVAIHGGLDPLDHSVWMPLDEPMMNAAHGIIVVQMEGWRESYGVGLEIKAFRAAGKPVLFLAVEGGDD